jgi:hypothetical protein
VGFTPREGSIPSSGTSIYGPVSAIGPIGPNSLLCVNCAGVLKISPGIAPWLTDPLLFADSAASTALPTATPRPASRRNMRRHHQSRDGGSEACVSARTSGRPCRQRAVIGMLDEDNARKGFFEPDQLQTLLKHLPAYLSPVFRVAYITGWRVKSELLTRQWRHVDFEHGCLRIEPGEDQNRFGRMFPFTKELREPVMRPIICCGGGSGWSGCV